MECKAGDLLRFARPRHNPATAQVKSPSDYGGFGLHLY
jgi:hypothetical protein